MAQTAAMRSEKKTKKCGVPFLAGTLAVLFILTVLLWGVSSGWGSISIKRTYLFADNGDKVSVISYIPDTATNENPAPVVLNFHGVPTLPIRWTPGPWSRPAAAMWC